MPSNMIGIRFSSLNIKGFYEQKFGVFNSQLGFIDVKNSTGDLNEIEYLKDKKPEQVALYSKILESIKKQIPSLYTYTTSSKQYIGIGAKDNTKKSFAEVMFKSDCLSFEIEKPVETSMLALGEEIENNGHHDHYFKVSVTEEADFDGVVAVIVNSYKQLKKDS